MQDTSQPPMADLSRVTPSPLSRIYRNVPVQAGTQACKRSFDVSSAVAILLFVLPIIAIVSLAILITQGRPIFIKHTRIGRRGREFPCYKFRTMINDADVALRAYLECNAEARAEWDASQKLKDDPRITPLGSVLRKASVDEIPQLWNIIRGDMSLVGPRPIVKREIRFYGSEIEKYYLVRPGITGAWQVGGRSDTSYETRVKLDVTYVDQQSFLGDMWILLKTVPAVLKMRGSC